MRFTTKQIALMTLLVRANEDGTFLDMDQLLERLPYETTKESLHFSVRTLIKHGMAEKRPRELRRSRMRSVLAPTSKAYLALSSTDSLSGVS